MPRYVSIHSSALLGVVGARVTRSNIVSPPQAYLKTEAYGYAISDATKAIEIDPSFVKVRKALFLLHTRITVGSPS